MVKALVFQHLKFVHNLTSDILEVTMGLIRIMSYIECDEEDAILGGLIRRVDLCPFPLTTIRRRNGQATLLFSNAVSAKSRNKSKRSAGADGQAIWVGVLGINRLIPHGGESFGALVTMFVSRGDDRAMVF